MTTAPQDLLLESFHAAVAAADPLKIVAAHLPPPPAGRVLVVGAGKAAASMAAAVEAAWPQVAIDGVVITRYGHGLPTRRIRVVEAGHPVPDEAGEAAAREILQRAQALGPGEINYDFLFAQLDSLGYAGWVGCEYKPRGTTTGGLAWLRRAMASTQLRAA